MGRKRRRNQLLPYGFECDCGSLSESMDALLALRRFGGTFWIHLPMPNQGVLCSGCKKQQKRVKIGSKVDWIGHRRLWDLANSIHIVWHCGVHSTVHCVV